ncbi:MAG: histidine phosphatase family protein [Clostridiales bacterium]|jgi:uncharacterized phosphatase|nr:histidine phosphatase family protein [Clostridiales bacterium]
MAKICLVRHGETDWNLLGKLQGNVDIPLNKTGVEQAKSAGRVLSETGEWDVIYSSPYKRAKKTASIIAEALNLPNVVELDLLKERDYGDASGLTKQEVQNRWVDGNVPNQESREALRERVVNALDIIVSTAPNKNVIIVSHGGVINSILAYVSGDEIGSGKTVLKNACVSVLDYSDGLWKVDFYNKSVF